MQGFKKTIKKSRKNQSSSQCKAAKENRKNQGSSQCNNRNLERIRSHLNFNPEGLELIPGQLRSQDRMLKTFPWSFYRAR